MATSSEKQRAATLRTYDILDSAQEKLFDDITELAAYLFSVPVARIAFIAEERVWHKASAGMPAQESLPREQAICSVAVQRDERVLVYSNLEHSVEKFELMRQRGVQFYAGALLQVPEGLSVGTLCVAGIEPRTFTPAEQEALACLADLVVKALAKRRQLLQSPVPEAWPALRAQTEAALQNHMALARYLKARSPEQIPVPQPVLDLMCERLHDVAKLLQ